MLPQFRVFAPVVWDSDTWPDADINVDCSNPPWLDWPSSSIDGNLSEVE
jgi:hypothetical protein